MLLRRERMPEVLVSIAHEGLAVMTIYFGLFLWYFDLLFFKIYKKRKHTFAPLQIDF